MRTISAPTPPTLAMLTALTLLAIAGCATTDTVEPAPPAPVPEPAPLTNLWEAAGAGDIDALKAHGAAGTNLNSLDPAAGITPLVAAVATRQHDAVRWLLNNGADANARTGDGGSALIAAGFFGESKIAKMLLDAGADASASNDNGQTVWDIAGLDWQTTKSIADFLGLEVERAALEAGRAEILAMLEPELDALAQDDAWLAAAIGDADAVRRQLDGGLDVDARNPESGTTLLTMAAIAGQHEVVAMLIDAGANVNKTNYQDGSAPLHAAAFIGHADVVALLLDNGADPNAMADDGGTALQAAELDWDTTQYIATTLQVPVDEATTMAGKAKVAELLRAATAR